MAIDHEELAEKFYVDFYEHAPDLYCLTDPDTGEIERCNQTFVDKLGYDDKSTIVDELETTFYAEDSHPRLLELRETLEVDDEVDGIEVEMVREDGSTFVGSLSATALRDEGELIGIRNAIRDISRRKESERELREKTERLERSNEQLEQFAYLASHDLQEPLRMVASYTQLLERRYRDELDDDARQYIDYAVEGAERMRDLINDLLTYSRVGGPDTSFEPIELEDLLQDVRANLQIMFDETDGTLEYDWTTSPVVEGDYSQLLQLFQNLINNALKFRGDESPRIEIGARHESDRWTLSVADNGIGFDPEHADRIFQIFQRLHERGDYEGTGAGLAIVKKIVDNHGGEVDVESTPGEGTTFHVTLPAVEG